MQTFMNRYIFTLVNVGAVPRSVTCSVIITVSDINDNSPSFRHQSESLVISESNAYRTAVIYKAIATDRDDKTIGPLVYHTQGQEDVFSIDLLSGVVTLLKYLEVGQYWLTITVTDSGTPPRNRAMILNITVVRQGRLLILYAEICPR